MFEKVFIGLTCISYVVLAGLLVFLCFRTRSKGLILITALFIGITFLGWIFDAVLSMILNAYIGQWEPGQDIRGVNLLSRLEIFMKIRHVTSLLDINLYLFGVFLIYKEWRQGKFRFPPTEQRAELKS